MTDQFSTSPDEHIVVGVDGSPPSTRALGWALRVAARRGWTVVVLTAWPDPADVFVHDVPGHACAPRARATAAQASAITQACATLPVPPPVVADVVNAHPVTALCDGARNARMVVLGSCGEQSPNRASRASVGESLALLTRCPVVLVEQAQELQAPGR